MVRRQTVLSTLFAFEYTKGSTMTAPSFLKPSTRPLSEDKLALIRDKAREAAATEMTIAELEANLSKEKIALYELYNKTLPDMMDEVGIAKLSLDKNGNQPAFD